MSLMRSYAQALGMGLGKSESYPTENVMTNGC